MQREHVEPIDDARQTGGFSRRGLLLGAGGAVAGFSALGGASASGNTEDFGELLPDSEVFIPGIDVFWGVIGGIFGPRTFYVLGPPPGGEKKIVAIPVGLVPGGFAVREGLVELMDFSPGDEVMLGGRWLDSGFAAAIIEQSYRSIRATVLSVKRGVISTTEGPVRLTPQTFPVGKPYPARKPSGKHAFLAKPLDEIKRGEFIYALGRRDGGREGLTAVSVSTASSQPHGGG